MTFDLLSSSMSRKMAALLANLPVMGRPHQKNHPFGLDSSYVSEILCLNDAEAHSLPRSSSIAKWLVLPAVKTLFFLGGHLVFLLIATITARLVIFIVTD
jgi:hypothetical protein